MNHTSIVALDLATYPQIARMQRVGMLVDHERAVELDRRLRAEMDDQLQALRGVTGMEDFNPQSGDQVAAWCFGEGLHLDKHTDTGKRYATDKKTLARANVKYAHPAFTLISQWRPRQKLVTAFLPALLRVAPGERLHPNLRTTSVLSGRLSAHDPNILAFPNKTEIGRMVRSCIIAAPGRVLFSLDLSQIEYRLLAHLAQVEKLLETFRAGLDLHTAAAAQFFTVDYAAVDKLSQRTPVKTINYLIIYGGGAGKLEEELVDAGVYGWPKARCQQAIDGWYAMYPEVVAYQDAVKMEARRLGFVRDMWGRIRKFPAIWLTGGRWPHTELRAEAIRQMLNHTIQGAAQGVIKRAQVRAEAIMEAFRANGWWAEILLQVHDELVGECDEDAWPLLEPLLREVMVADQDLFTVPIETSSSAAADWGSLKG